MSLNPDSVSTVRIMTELYPSEEARVVGAFFRIGLAENQKKILSWQAAESSIPKASQKDSLI